MSQNVYVYGLPPIDFWAGAMTRDQLLSALGTEEHLGLRFLSETLREAADLNSATLAAAEQMGWEGDIREGPFWFAVPCEQGMEFGIVFKQDNNGTTYVGSPVPLAHLDDLAFDRKTVARDTQSWAYEQQHIPLV